MRKLWQQKKIKLASVFVLAFIITKLVSPLIGTAYPIRPTLANLAFQTQQLKNNLKIPEITLIPHLATISSLLPVLPDLSISPSGSQNGSSSNQTIPTLIPTQPFIPNPTYLDSPLQGLTPYPTTNPYPQVTSPKTQPTFYLTPYPTGYPLPYSPTPKLTNAPKPTKPPKPTPIKLQVVRPGKNFQDTANIVGEIMCVPPAMIMAILDNEYGPWMGQVEANWTARNTYTGSDPHNNPGSTIIPTSCVMQIMEDTWSRIKPVLGNKNSSPKLSLAVTFDAMAAGAYHVRNVSLAMQDKVSCDDWPAKYILYGACRYNGACVPGSTTYNQYSYDVCNAYNRYTNGPKKNCK